MEGGGREWVIILLKGYEYWKHPHLLKINCFELSNDTIVGIITSLREKYVGAYSYLRWLCDINQASSKPAPDSIT